MKPLPLVLGLLAAVLPLRAQNIFSVSENGAVLPVRAIEDRQPFVLDHGRWRRSDSTRYSLRRAQIFSLGTLDIGAFKIEFTHALSDSDEPDLHIYGRLKADIPLRHCFFVIKVTGDLGTGLFFDGLPDLPANEEVRYDRRFPYAAQAHGMVQIAGVYLFADGLQLLTSRDDPFFVSQQHEKTRQALQRQRSAR